ncbi:integrase [Flavobacterium psychrophilum]|uniref:Probable transposase n=1 Tax=Flavobacterium psychrophilum (strain ATCC 49511 / DSM 21280 / CIP 103535 / JIP02/86) TaxID=402612 RepID=R7RU37_FLAPJ|nr:tyrosine-type recombinase/integrase [Flavobacterium psychrophilum]AIG29402.1 integrase [Flavobacterium psychrophilum]AIG31679.1 integrase [Flavobacterium psychrophilum]AIG33833.1 integrase [Flavobacterium psychrophilum]AIG36195.1 integrase [Flavobacterium psychrophilum]AIG38461.1 integrase [Flavobacterium psychrophilum]
MKYTFNLKEPKSAKETLILFSCYFKHENKKFVFSTGEHIVPEFWDFDSRSPIERGKNKSLFAQSIKMQLNRYSTLFLETESLYKRVGEDFTSKILKKVFAEEFKRIPSGKNIFFDSYDEFTNEKIKSKEWSISTIKRYQNIKNILKNFEKSKNFNLTFSKIDDEFHREFTSYCMDDLLHINNTYARNLGLFKTFMFWAKKKKFTFNDAFLEFKKVDKVITNQIALTLEDLEKLMNFQFESEKLERVRDVFVFACVTGMRFGELSTIRRSNVTDVDIVLKEDKDHNKPTRNIPLTSISKFILSKYDYKLPLIANQKQNEYIKEVFKAMEYNSLVEKVTTKGKENIKQEMFFYDRISTHTARRTFITMMKRQGKSDKLIARITGHTDMKTLNQYYQVDDTQTKEAMDEVFNIELKLKVV